METNAAVEDKSRITTALLLIAVPTLFLVLFTLLGQQFEYPDILRKPGGYVLEAFHRGGGGLRALWYGMMLAALLFIPLAVGVGRWIAKETLTVAIGIIAGLVQALGLARWVFLTPFLAERYLDPATSPAGREAVLVVFDAFNRFFGNGIGEHLGYLFTGLWTLLVALSLRQNRHPYLGAIGILLAVGVLSGTLEAGGVAWASSTTAISYTLWSIWMIALGITLLRLPGETASEISTR